MSSELSRTLQTLPIAAVLLISLGGLAIAQQNVTLDGTSGSESTSGNLSTNGGLNIALGFLAEYLVVAGGGGGQALVLIAPRSVAAAAARVG